MNFTVTEESFAGLAAYRRDPRVPLRWGCVSILPEWLKAWWSQFQDDWDLFLRAVHRGRRLVGIAPLMRRGAQAAFVGDADVCDYLDFAVVPGGEGDFFTALLEDLDRQGVKELDLRPLRPDSATLLHLAGIAEKQGCRVVTTAEDVALEMDLPGGWEAYLERLSGKQRHEVRRKLRRLEEAGHSAFRTYHEARTIRAAMDTFLALFERNREDKAAFMTGSMTAFFSLLAEGLAGEGIMRLGVLEVASEPAAAVMCFQYNGTTYLYNNAYDRRFAALSVGQLGKVLSIKDSIEKGARRYDFMRGAEPYKRRLGGREVLLSRCRIEI